MPFLESVYLKGLTIKQAKEKIGKRLSPELIRPEIYIKLVKSRASKISMLGELQNPICILLILQNCTGFS